MTDTCAISISNNQIAKCLFLDSLPPLTCFLDCSLFLELRCYPEYYIHFMACLIRVTSQLYLVGQTAKDKKKC